MHPRNIEVFPRGIDQPGQVLACADSTDWSRQHIIKHQSRDRELGGSAAQRLAHDSVDTAADKHATALDLNRAHGVRKKHDREDEPWRSFADRLLCAAADIIGARAKIAQDNSSRPPERYEGQHDGDWNDEFV